MPFFTVVITVYNKEAFIQNTLLSVLNQSYLDYDIIIVNDGSTDNSLKVIEQNIPNNATLFSIENSGAAAARNFGIRKAKGKYIALLDGDDYWYPDFLKEIKKLIDLYPNESVYATAIKLKNKHITFPAKYAIPNKEYLVIDYFKGSLLRTLLSASSTVIKYNVFDTVGYFNENFVSSEDTEYWIRIGLKYPIAFSSKTCVTYIDISDSLSNTHQDINQKPRYDQFKEAEKDNVYLKKVLDFNRFSLAIQSKINNDYNNYKFYSSSLSTTSLNWKQRFLLKLPGFCLKGLVFFKNFLRRKNIILRVLD